jgi:hypothetical protein
VRSAARARIREKHYSRCINRSFGRNPKLR